MDRIESIGKPDTTRSTIPPDPNRGDYPNIRFWDEDSMNAYTPPEGVKNVKLTMYLEYENGQRIPQALIVKINDELRGYWDDMLTKEGEVPKNWSELGLKRKDGFRATFAGRYPWLRLCAFGWKIDRLWIDRFGGWEKKHSDLYGTADSARGSSSPDPDPITKNTTPGPSLSTRIPSLIGVAPEDFDLTQATAGSKRGREDPEEINSDVSKRRKSNDILMAPTKFTNKPKPRPKTKNPSLGQPKKVNIFSILRYLCADTS
jgi:hypothetical protein